MKAARACLVPQPAAAPPLQLVAQSVSLACSQATDAGAGQRRRHWICPKPPGSAALHPTHQPTNPPCAAAANRVCVHSSPGCSSMAGWAGWQPGRRLSWAPLAAESGNAGRRVGRQSSPGPAFPFRTASHRTRLHTPTAAMTRTWEVACPATGGLPKRSPVAGWRQGAAAPLGSASAHRHTSGRGWCSCGRKHARHAPSQPRRGRTA